MAFMGCMKLSDIHFPNGLKYIGYNSFSGCNITSIIIPDSIEFFDLKPFDNIAYINPSKISSNDTEIKYPFFYYLDQPFIIPPNIKSIGPNSFLYTNITSILIPSTIETVQSYAFSESKIINISIESPLTKLEPLVFSYTKLETINIPESIIEFPHSAFFNCYFETFTVPRNIRRLDETAFAYCWNLKTLIINADFELFECKISLDIVPSIQNIFINCKNLIIQTRIQRLNQLVINASSSVSIEYIEIFESIEHFEVNTPLLLKYNIRGAGYKVKASNNFFVNTTIPNYFMQGCSDLIEINETCFITSSNKIISFPDNITTVGQYAFANCENLQKVVLNENISFIDKYAFDKCWGINHFEYKCIDFNMEIQEFHSFGLIIKPSKFLSNKILPYQYFENDSITTFTIDEGIDAIGYAAFAHSSIQTITLNEKIITIPQFCFYNCFQLKSVINCHAKDIYDSAFCGCVALNDINISTVEFIAQHAFESTSLYNLVVSAISIQDYAFANAIILNLELKNNVSIGPYAFYTNKSMINQLILGSSIIQLPQYIFYNSNITEYTIPNNIKIIEPYCFYGCKNLKFIHNIKNVNYIGSSAFEGCISLTGLIDLTNIIEFIGEKAFKECTSITSINCSNMIEIIHPETFFNCISLGSFEFPRILSTIQSKAFYNCISLNNIQLPDTIISLEESCLYNCNLSQFNYLNKSLDPLYSNSIYIGLKVFDQSNIETINITCNSITIDSYAISECNRLKEVIIDAMYGTIYPNAFNNCLNLINIDLKQSQLMFISISFYNVSFHSIRFPNGTQFSVFPFSKCQNLQVVNFEGILSVNEYRSIVEDFLFELKYTGSEKTDYFVDDFFTYFIYINKLKVHVPDTYLIDSFCGIDTIREREPISKRKLREKLKHEIISIPPDFNTTIVCYQNYDDNKPTLLHIGKIISMFSQSLINSLKS